MRKSTRRILAIIMTVAMIFTSMATTIFADNSGSTSNPADNGSTYAESASILQGYGVFVGDGNGNLMLNQQLKRQDAVIIALRLMGKQDSEFENYNIPSDFTDITDSYYLPIIGMAQDLGLIEGMSDGTFGFNQYVTAQQLETILLRALGYEITDDIYAQVPQLAEQVGITNLTSTQGTTQIARDIVAQMMLNTLNANVKDSDQKLGVQLGFMEEEPPVTTALEVKSATMASDTAIKVTFNRAVADTSKLTFAVTGASVLNPTVTWNDAKTEATLTNPSVILEGAYTVKVSGDTFAEGKDTANLTIVKNGIAKIEILGDKLVRTDGTHGQFNFKLTDSYGNDVTEKMSYDVAINTSLGAGTGSLKDYKTGLVEVTKGGGWTNYPVTPELVTITLYAKTAVNGAVATASATLNVTELTHVDKVTLGAIEYPTTSPATTSVKVNKAIAAYIPLTATDKFGTDVTETTNLNVDDSTDVFYSVSDSTVKTNLQIEKYTNAAGKDALRLVVSTIGLSDSDANRNVTIQVVSKYTGSQSNVVTFPLKKSSAAEKVTLMAPEKLVAEGDTYDEGLVIPMVVLDQDGKQLTPDEIVDNANNITITAAGAAGESASTFGLKIATSGPNKGKIVGSTENIVKGTKTIMAQVANSTTGSVSSIAFEVKDAAYPRTIQLNQTPAQNLLAGATTKLSYKFLDQYGRVMEDSMLSDATLVGAHYKVKFTTSNGTYVTTSGYTDGAGSAVAASTLTADDTIGVTAKSTAGTARIKAELCDKDSTTAVVSSVETSFTVTEGMPSNLTYSIGDVQTLFAYGSAFANAAAIEAANAATEAHVVPLSIVGTDSNGTTYAIPQSNILSVSSSDTTLVGIEKVGNATLKNLDNKVVVYGIDDAFTSNDASNATKQATIKVVIAADNGVKEVTKTITVSKEASKAAQIVFADKALDADNVTSLNKDAKTLTDLAGSTTQINAQDVYVYEVDQYGVYTDVTPASLTIVNKDKYSNDTTVAISAHNLAVNASKIKANEQVFLMYTAADGVYGTISVRANDGVTNLDLTAPVAPVGANMTLTDNATPAVDTLAGAAGAVEANATVNVYSDAGLTTLVGTATADATGAFAAINLADNTGSTSVNYYVVAVDAAGNVSASTTMNDPGVN